MQTTLRPGVIAVGALAALLFTLPVSAGDSLAPAGYQRMPVGPPAPPSAWGEWSASASPVRPFSAASQVGSQATMRQWGQGGWSTQPSPWNNNGAPTQWSGRLPPGGGPDAGQRFGTGPGAANQQGSPDGAPARGRIRGQLRNLWNRWGPGDSW
jgi:hypothetical protein